MRRAFVNLGCYNAVNHHCYSLNMAEDQGKQDKEKIDFTREGEALGYISLDQARVLAMRTARETPGAYGRRLRNIPMAFAVVGDSETEDHYVVTLSYRPEGQFTGTPGQEQFFIEKEGVVAFRQVLSLPRREGERRLPVAAVAIGLVALVIVVIVGVVFAVGGSSNSENPAAANAAVPVGSTSQPAAPNIQPTSTAAPLLSPAANPTPSTPTNASGLSRGGIISGVVTDADTKRPIPGIQIEARNVEQDNPRYSIPSDGSGRYTLSGIAPGQYRVRVTFGSGDYIPEVYDDRLNWDAADIVTVRGPDPIDGIDFALKIGAQISGTVTDAETGRPISNARLNAGPVAWEWMIGTETDADGNYTIRGLPDGLTRVAANDERFGYVSQRRTVSVTGLETLTGLDIALVLGATISGRVTDLGTGLPIANQSVDVENVQGDDGPRASARTDRDGRYKLFGIAPGTYRVRLCCPDLEYIREYYDGKLTQRDADVINITGMEPVEGIDFALKRGATISGIVRDGLTGLGIPGMNVRAGLEGWPFLRWANTDGYGEYTLSVVPNGAIVVVVEGQGYVQQEKTVTVTGGVDVTGFDF